MNEEEIKIRKALDLFERYVQALVYATGIGPMHPHDALQMVREEVVTAIKKELEQ
jgi:hypothetical protein